MDVNYFFHSKTKEEVFKELATSEKGLSEEEAKKRLERYGKNTIKKTHRLRPLRILLEQFKSFLVYILIIAAAVSFFIGNFLDGIAISAIVVLNAAIGFFQQYRAEKAIISLKRLIVPKSLVIRNGVMTEVPSSELVPGDIVILNAGDSVNADCRIIEAENLQANEAALTGESLPVAKSSERLPEKASITEMKNMLFAGTQITRGRAKAVVVATGMKSVFGKIAETLQDIELQKTPVQKRLDTFSKQIGIFILGFVGIVMLLGILEQFDSMEMFFTAVALAVSAIPEGLPTVLTLAFAISSMFMSKRNVIVRRLPAVESLGSISVICSDKTGTITEEKMKVQKLFVGNSFYEKREDGLYQVTMSSGNKIKERKINLKKSKDVFQLLKTSILCNDARFELVKGRYVLFGDPTEEALLSAALDLGLDKKIMTELEPSVKKIDFDSKRKMMSVLRSSGRHYTLYSKGAPEKILEACGFEFSSRGIKKLSEERKNFLREQLKKMELDALRVLGFAYKIFHSKNPVEKGMAFLGFIGMLDPPRKEVKEAIKECKAAGISVKMITGDSEITAMAIAKKIGISGKILTEEELEKMTDSELENVIDEISVFARTTPHQKLRITKILQKKGEIVAITGDGINDSLALKSADVGIAMGKRGTDVARDSSDIILVDDNFKSIVEGVKEGRKTYDNIKKFTKYLLSVNFSAIFLVLFALFFRLPLPLIPLQILWMNLITDSFPALALIFEKGEDVMKTPPRKEKSILDGIWKFIIIAGSVAFFAELLIYLIGINNFEIEKTRTLVLTGAILFELFFVYSCRTNKSLFKDGFKQGIRNFFSNKWINYAVLFSAALHLLLIYSPLSGVFSLVSLNAIDWILILPFAVSGVLIFEIGKFFIDKKKSPLLKRGKKRG